MKSLKISKEEKIKIDKAANRIAHIEAGLNINHHRVFRNKKTYSRKSKYANKISNE